MQPGDAPSHARARLPCSWRTLLAGLVLIAGSVAIARSSPRAGAAAGDVDRPSDEVSGSAEGIPGGVEVGVSERKRAETRASIAGASCSFVTGIMGSEVVARLGSIPFEGTEITDLMALYTLALCDVPILDGRGYALWIEQDGPPRAVVDWLVARAVSQARAPDPVVRGAPDGSVVPHVVNLESWWWIDDSSWQPVSASAEIPGGPAVTATLTPTASIWTVDGREPVRCGRGIPFRPELSADVVGHCGMVFDDVTDRGGLRQTVSVRFAVSIRCVPSGLCDEITVPGPVIASTTTTIHVIQIRGVLLE
jgi:hypothetical protein